MVIIVKIIVDQQSFSKGYERGDSFTFNRDWTCDSSNQRKPTAMQVKPRKNTPYDNQEKITSSLQ